MMIFIYLYPPIVRTHPCRRRQKSRFLMLSPSENLSRQIFYRMETLPKSVATLPQPVGVWRRRGRCENQRPERLHIARQGVDRQPAVRAEHQIDGADDPAKERRGITLPARQPAPTLFVRRWSKPAERGNGFCRAEWIISRPMQRPATWRTVEQALPLPSCPADPVTSDAPEFVDRDLVPNARREIGVGLEPGASFGSVFRLDDD